MLAKERKESMFDSRSAAYREPFGAVEEGCAVHFRITVPRELHCSAARLCIEKDGQGRESFGMFWCGMNGESQEWWECHYTPASSGLYFYCFSLDTWKGVLEIRRLPGGQDTLDPSGGLWQMTVYEKGFTTPDWLAGGILYQIFPDRFCRLGDLPSEQDLPYGRQLHGNWEEEPCWRPNEQGKITNSDYFGGNLQGIREKLPYLASLGVTCLYLNPIFEAHSNHRYNTADYSRIDPLLGTEEDLEALCKEGEALGIRVLLDGVFSHTGSDSVYFNWEGRYPQPGAFTSRESPYFSWYSFRNWPWEYECWWNFDTLPNVRETNPAYTQYISGEEGIARLWLRQGAKGWRLDVADELPDGFLDGFRQAVKAEDPQALVLGEVWEDASNKSAYGVRRRYLLGRQLDSVMNYPFRNAILGFLTGASPQDMMEILLSVAENYPPQVLRLLMNHIGTHDTERALTVLGDEPAGGRDREWQSRKCLSPEERKNGLRLLRMASAMQFTLPGVPCIYYGDEAGMEGYRDPFNRRTFPWGREDTSLVNWYKKLGVFRKSCSCLKEGSFQPWRAQDGVLAYIRRDEKDAVFCAVNRDPAPKRFSLPREWKDALAFIGAPPDEEGNLFMEPVSCTLLRLCPGEKAAKKAAISIRKEEKERPEPHTASQLASAGPRRKT